MLFKKNRNCYLWVEEYFGSEETLISNVYVELVFADGVDSFVFLDPLPGVGVILGEFLHNVWTDVAEPFLRASNRSSINRKKHPEADSCQQAAHSTVRIMTSQMSYKCRFS